MKRTFIDRLIGFFSPEAEARRVHFRTKRDLALRAYDVAKTFTQSDWISSNSSSANAELKSAIKPGREKARALVQNAPYGVKALDVIVSETVGSGIVANIKGRNKTQTKKIQALWKEWAESTKCDYEGRNNFYAMQELLMRSVVEAGEGLVLKKFDADGLKLQLIESDYIVTEKDQEGYIQGIEVKNGKRTKYCLHKGHPGDAIAKLDTQEVAADQICHIYKQKRAGQVRGISWAHAVIEKMKDHEDYQTASLIRQKIAACFGGFVTTNGNDSLIDAATLKEKRQNEFAMEPATFRYLAPGEDVKLASPPGVEGYSDFNRETLRAIAAGWGISYEALTGDYSQSNYSSSRLGHIQMRKNIESWRWNMFIPQFCDVVWSWFLDYAKLVGVDTNGVSVKWVPPAYSLIDPSKEIEATKKEVRAGFKSWGEAVLEMGRDPEDTLSEIAEWNQKFDENKVILDSDPRKITQIGMVQSQDPNSLDSQDNNNSTNNGDLSSGK